MDSVAILKTITWCKIPGGFVDDLFSCSCWYLWFKRRQEQNLSGFKQGKPPGLLASFLSSMALTAVSISAFGLMVGRSSSPLSLRSSQTSPDQTSWYEQYQRSARSTLSLQHRTSNFDKAQVWSADNTAWFCQSKPWDVPEENTNPWFCNGKFEWE